MFGYKPYKENLYTYKMALRIQENRSFKRVFKVDLTRAIMSDLRNIANPNHLFTMNTIINLSGGTGEGKSTSIISLSKEIFNDFTYKNVFFFDQDILDNASNFPENTILIRDENPQKAIFGVGSSRTSAQIGVLAETCRAEGLNLAFVEPNFIQTDITKLILETVDMDIEKRITRLAVRDTRSLQYMGALYINILPDDDEDIKGYFKKKKKFTTDMKSSKMVGAKTNPRDIAMEILNEIDFDIYSSKKEIRNYKIQDFLLT